jgi:pimeloyl-ACP methyl ester carboxylesterase
MSAISGTAVQVTLLTRPRAWLLGTLWAGGSASVPAALIATLAVLSTPHVRGLGFLTELRWAVLTPVTFVTAVAAALAYRGLQLRSENPRRALAIALASLAALALLGVAAVGGTGLAFAALPAALSVATILAWLIPGWVERPMRSRAGTAVLLLLGALEGALWVAAVASERDAPASQIPSAFDAEHKFLQLASGARIHYVDEGQGETLLFLHGNPAWSFQWRELIRSLRGSYRCVALDYPGFGFSTARAGYGFTPREQSHVVEEFVDKLGLRDVTLVMQDWGGPIGLGWAGRRPELVRAVVAGSTWAWPTSKQEPRGIFSLIAGGPLGEFVQINFNGFAKFGVEQGIVQPKAEATLDGYLLPFRALDRRGIAAFYPGQITAATDFFREVQAGLPRLADKPALLFWAALDQGFPRADLTRFETAFPNHETHELPHANHFFFEDAAEEMVPKIRAFMAPDR